MGTGAPQALVIFLAIQLADPPTSAISYGNPPSKWQPTILTRTTHVDDQRTAAKVPASSR